VKENKRAVLFVILGVLLLLIPILLVAFVTGPTLKTEEFACTLKNCARKEALIWAQLEEVLPEHAEPHAPLRLRQSIPLSEDEEADREIGSNTTLSSARYSIVVKGTVESKLFFKLNESMNVHMMAFSLHFSRKHQEPRQKPLFTVEV
jgi:hypothetical protein